MFIAIQYWEKDEARALRLARLLADLEPRSRKDATIILARRFDTELSAEAFATAQYVGRKLPVMMVRSKRTGVGHPAGCNGLMAGVMDHLTDMWRSGDLLRSSVFLAEADGCPLRRDWLTILMEEQARAVTAGKGICGPYMNCFLPNGKTLPHINGTLVMHVPWWIDHPSVHNTPPDQGWDIFHAPVMVPAAWRTTMILNIHHSKNWTADQLVPLAADHAWLTSVKDFSVLEWAENALVPMETRELRRLRAENERLKAGR
jgi:hypothetical protein